MLDLFTKILYEMLEMFPLIPRLCLGMHKFYLDIDSILVLSLVLVRLKKGIRAKL